MPPPPDWELCTPELANWSGTLVALVRKQLGWTKTQLARNAAISVPTLFKLENREHVRDVMLHRVVAALNQGLVQDPLQLNLFPPFDVREIGAIRSGIAWSIPGPVEGNACGQVFRKLLDRRFTHQQPFATAA